MSAPLDRPEQIAMFRYLAMRGRLHIEMKGLMFRGPSTTSILRAEGITASRYRAVALRDLNAHIEALGGPADTRGEVA